MLITLDRRDCVIGPDSSSKVKAKKGQELRLLTFELEEVELEERELNAFLREPHAWKSLYNDRNGEITPFLKCFKTLEIEKSVEGAFVELTYGLDSNRMAFTECKLSKIKLALCDGGNTKLSCKVTTAPTLDETLAELFEQFGKPAEVEIRAEPPGAQKDLPLSTHGNGEQPALKSKAKRAAAKKGGRPISRPGAH
jgi:hypothetical protein